MTRLIPRLRAPSARLAICLLPLSLLTACSFSLAEDIPPPAGYQAPSVTQVAPPVAAEPLYPLTSPDPMAGRLIYTEKCAPCHGDRGLGDGPQASQLPNSTSQIGSRELARQVAPAEWFNTTTRGNLERFMPPFANSLSDSERWDVVAYVYTLSTSVDEVALGEELYQANCAACHGEGARGDGPEAADLASPPGDLSDLSRLSAWSDADLYQAITVGVSPAMPAFADQLGDADRWALTAYLRSLSFGSPVDMGIAQEPAPAPAGPEVDPPETAAEGVGQVTGSVINGSGGDLPATLDVTLRGFDNMEAVYTTTASVDSGGGFAFQNVEMPVGRVFLVTVNYNQATYGSEVAIVEPDNVTLDLPVTVFDTTSDTSSLFVDRLHMFFEFLAADIVQVTELYLISNPSMEVIVPTSQGQPVVTFTLPEGATNLQFQDGALGERYIQTADGFGDTLGVRPGSGQYQVLFSYDLPYDGKLNLDRLQKLPVNAVILVIPEDGVRVKSDYLEDNGSRQIQDEMYHVYSGENIAAGSPLIFALSGRPRGAAGALEDVDSSVSLAIGVGAVGIALAAAGVWIYRRNQAVGALEGETEPLSDTFTDRDSLMDAIIALDDLYQAGELPEEAYRQRRIELKSRLEELLGD